MMHEALEVTDEIVEPTYPTTFLFSGDDVASLL